MNNIIMLISLIISFISIVVSIYYGITNAKIKREFKTVKWSDFPSIADFVYKKCKGNNFMPDIIFIANPAYYHIAKSILLKFNNDNILIINGMLINKNESSVPDILKNEFHVFDTTIRHVLLPKSLFENKNNKILFVGGWVVTGNILNGIKKYLQKESIPEENFKSFCLATTNIAKDLNSSPDYYWKEVSVEEGLYLPWGKLIV